MPPFFYGFNQYFFLHDIEGARAALETAATRATDNAAGFRKFAIMLAAGELKDDSAALEFLQRERAATADTKLQGMLDKRIARVLWNDPGTGVMRHADAGYDIAVQCAKEQGLKLPMV